MSWLYKGSAWYEGTLLDSGTALNLSSAVTGVQAGDLVVATVSIGYGLYEITGATGWTEIHQTDYTGYVRSATYWKQVDEDDIDEDHTWYVAASYPGNITYNVYRPRTESTVSVSSYDAIATKTTYPITSTLYAQDDRSFFHASEVIDGGYDNTNNAYLWNYTSSVSEQMIQPFFDFDSPSTGTHYLYADAVTTTTSGLDRKFRVRTNYDEAIVTLVIFTHSDSEGEDPSAGYGHNVFGVDSGDIASVFGVDTANINSVFGVE